MNHVNHEAIDFSQAKTTPMFGRQILVTPIEAVKNLQLKAALLTLSLACAPKAEMLRAAKVVRSTGFEAASEGGARHPGCLYVQPTCKPDADFIVSFDSILGFAQLDQPNSTQLSVA